MSLKLPLEIEFEKKLKQAEENTNKILNNKQKPNLIKALLFYKEYDPTLTPRWKISQEITIDKETTNAFHAQGWFGGTWYEKNDYTYELIQDPNYS